MERRKVANSSPGREDANAIKADVPLYDVVNYKEAEDSNHDYSTVCVADMNRENLYAEATAASHSGNWKGDKVRSVSRNMIYLVAVLVCIAMLTLLFSCFIAIFLQITDMKSQLQSNKLQIANDILEGVDIQRSEVQQLIENKLEEYKNGSLLSLEDMLNDIKDFQNGTIQWLNMSIDEVLGTIYRGLSFFYPATSCAALPLSSPSGYYWVRASNGSAVRVYCDMTRSCGGVTGGWRRVAELDMTNSSHQCPSGLRQRTDSNKHTCVRNSDSAGCSSVTISTATVGYSRVCGKIIGYQVGSTNAFSSVGRGPNQTLDSYYVDGVSLTHGNPRQHVWTFAAGLHEISSSPTYNCPCIANVPETQPPAFVGSDYFCDTGSAGRFSSGLFYASDPLWDGAGCGPLNTCCSFNNPPWFSKQLPQPTTDDIEMRVCRDQDADNEDVAVEMTEIYVQ